MVNERSEAGWSGGDDVGAQLVRGEVCEGVLVELRDEGAVIDLAGTGRDGFAPRDDLVKAEREWERHLAPGDPVMVRVVQPRDGEGTILVSLHDALEEEDWQRAEALLASGEAWRGTVASCNRGGLLVRFGRLKVFVPASHLGPQSRHKRSAAQREAILAGYVGREVPLQFIELDRERRRLVASERLGRERERQESLNQLLSELREGDIVEGRVCHLCDFGAFVDLGGVDGLIHISELDWGKVGHPRDVVELGERVEVYVLNLDPERERIGLSLKRLQPSPWELAERTLREGQLVSGTVTNVVDFGAFLALDDLPVEGLLHNSELSDPPPADPRRTVNRGDRLLVRILRLDPLRRRMRLSLRSVSDSERDAWLGRQGSEPGTDEDR